MVSRGHTLHRTTNHGWPDADKRVSGYVSGASVTRPIPPPPSAHLRGKCFPFSCGNTHCNIVIARTLLIVQNLRSVHSVVLRESALCKQGCHSWVQAFVSGISLHFLALSVNAVKRSTDAHHKRIVLAIILAFRICCRGS